MSNTIPSDPERRDDAAADPSYGTAAAPYAAYTAPTGSPAPYGTPAPPTNVAPYGYTTPQPNPAYPAPYGTVPGYGGYPVGAAGAVGRTNVLAIISLIASGVGLIFLPFVGSLTGIVTGHIALSQIKRTFENGRGLALAGTILGWASLGFWILLIGAVIVLPLLFAAGVAGSVPRYT